FIINKYNDIDINNGSNERFSKLLFEALSFGNDEIALLLLSHKNINIDNYMITHWAIMSRINEIGRIVISRNDVNLEYDSACDHSDNGIVETFLELACKEGRLDLVKI